MYFSPLVSPDVEGLKYINPSVNVFPPWGPGTTDADPHVTCAQQHDTL